MFKNVIFDDVFVSEKLNEITYYFILDTEVLKDFNIEIPEKTVHSELSISLPLDDQEIYNAVVEISPTVEDDDYSEDIDWNEIVLPTDEIEELIKIAKKEIKNEN